MQLTNTVVFFFSGAACVNFLIRSMRALEHTGNGGALAVAFWRLPLIFVSIMVVRALLIALFSPMLKIFGAQMDWRVRMGIQQAHHELPQPSCFWFVVIEPDLNGQNFVAVDQVRRDKQIQGPMEQWMISACMQGVLLCTVGGLRGALCLIMVQTVVLDIGADGVVNMSETLSVVKSSLALWTTGVVLCTLLINAPALGFVLRVTGLTKVSFLTLQSRDKARQQFLKFTNDCIHELQADEDELLQVSPPAQASGYAAARLLYDYTSGAHGSPAKARPSARAPLRLVSNSLLWLCLQHW